MQNSRTKPEHNWAQAEAKTRAPSSHADSGKRRSLRSARNMARPTRRTHPRQRRNTPCSEKPNNALLRRTPSAAATPACIAARPLPKVNAPRALIYARPTPAPDTAQRTPTPLDPNNASPSLFYTFQDHPHAAARLARFARALDPPLFPPSENCG